MKNKQQLHRSIEFRVYDKRDQIMYYSEKFSGYYMLNIAGEGLYNGEYDYGNNLFYQQFTGLLDKNGKKIFEGDIVKYIFGNNEICLVKFGVYDNVLNQDSGNGWYLVTSYNNTLIEKEDINSTNTGTGQFFSGINYEIIGNIFENPAL